MDDVRVCSTSSPTPIERMHNRDSIGRPFAYVARQPLRHQSTDGGSVVDSHLIGGAFTVDDMKSGARITRQIVRRRRYLPITTTATGTNFVNFLVSFLSYVVLVAPSSLDDEDDDDGDGDYVRIA